MAQQLPHVIPSIYLANYLNDFEPLFPRYGVTPLGRKKRWKGSNIKKRPKAGAKQVLSKSGFPKGEPLFCVHTGGGFHVSKRVIYLIKKGKHLGENPPGLAANREDNVPARARGFFQA